MNAPRRNERKEAPLSVVMPSITAWVATLREAFGDEMMDDVIRRGHRGEPVFYAKENGVEFGTPLPPPASLWQCQGLSDRHLCSLCCGDCKGTRPMCRTHSRDLAR